MFGLTKSQWEKLLSCDNTVRAALAYDPTIEAEQRAYKLEQIKRDELMYSLRNLEDPATATAGKLHDRPREGAV